MYGWTGSSTPAFSPALARIRPAHIGDYLDNHPCPVSDTLFAVPEDHKELPGKAKGFYVVRTRKGRQYGAKHATDRDDESINTQLRWAISART